MSTATTQIIISGKDQLSGVVADAGRRMGTELQSMQRNVLSLQNAFMALAGAAALGQMRQVYSEYDASLRDMVKVTDESQAAIAAKMKSVPAELGNTTELIQGYYQVISAGITDPVKAMDTLTGSVEAAKTAHLAQSEVIKGITKVMAGYAGDVKSATEAADLLFTIEKQGQTSFAELIPVIGDVSAISKQLGVDQTEMGAALAAVTQTAGSTSQAATQYRMMLVNLMKPTKDMQEALDGIGASSGQAAVQQYGLAGTLERLQEYARRSGVSVAKLFESSEALLSVAALSRGEFAQYNINLQAMEARAGAADKAFQEWQKSTQAVDDLFRNTMTNTLIKIGEKVMPTVNDAVREFAEYVGQHDDEIAGVFGEMAEYGRQIGAAMVPALKETGNVLARDIIPAVSGVARSASDLLNLVPADYQSAVGGGLIGYALLGRKGALIGATIVGIKEALDDLWGDEASSKQGDNIDRVLAAAEKRLEAAQRRLRQAERLPGSNSSALSSAQSDIDHEMALIARLEAAKSKVVGVQKTLTDTWGAIERKGLEGVSAVSAALPAIVQPPIQGIVGASKSAETEMARLREEIARLTMAEADFEHYKIDQEFAKIVKEIGAANPLLAKWVALRREEAESIRGKSVGKELEDYFGDIDKQYAEVLKKAETEKEKNEEILLDFSDRYREVVVGETEFKKEQLERQAEIFRKAGADEIAVAQWVAQEKLAVSRDWQDGATRALQTYADEAGNAAKNVEDVMGMAFTGMEDMIVEFVKTGKLEFADLVTSINAEIARLAFRSMASEAYDWMGGLLKTGLSMAGSYFSGGASLSPSVAPSGAAGLYYSVGHHAGGIVGSEPTFMRAVHPAVFAGADRFHTGGIAGYEVPAILKRGEGVFTEGQMKAIGGGNAEMTALLRELVAATRAQRGTKIVNAIGKGAIANELSGFEGEQVVFNHIRRNPSAVRRMLGL